MGASVRGHSKFTMGTAGGPTFLAAMRDWENHILKYNEEGREIITKQRTEGQVAATSNQSSWDVQ